MRQIIRAAAVDTRAPAALEGAGIVDPERARTIAHDVAQGQRLPGPRKELSHAAEELSRDLIQTLSGIIIRG